MTKAYDWVDFSEWITTVKSGSRIEIWTDGGCNPNPGPGGWGAILQHGKKRCILMGGHPSTTNNRMEVAAALVAIDCLPAGCKIFLTSDSQYVCKGISHWIYGWKRRNWVKKDGNPVTNSDLWKDMATAISRHRVKTNWVKGHNGHDENELCDYLASYSVVAMGDKVRKELYTNAKHLKDIKDTDFIPPAPKEQEPKRPTKKQKLIEKIRRRNKLIL